MDWFWGFVFGIFFGIAMVAMVSDENPDHLHQVEEAIEECESEPPSEDVGCEFRIETYVECDQ